MYSGACWKLQAWQKGRLITPDAFGKRVGSSELIEAQLKRRRVEVVEAKEGPKRGGG
jgi:hypothetical protein